MTLYKIRAETERYGIALEADLDDGETLTGTPTVRVLDENLADVSTEFGVTAPGYGTVDLPDGGQQQGVLFTLAAAAQPADQAPGRYYVEAKFGTSGGRSPIATDATGHLPVLVVRA